MQVRNFFQRKCVDCSESDMEVGTDHPHKTNLNQKNLCHMKWLLPSDSQQFVTLRMPGIVTMGFGIKQFLHVLKPDHPNKKNDNIGWKFRQ